MNEHKKLERHIVTDEVFEAFIAIFNAMHARGMVTCSKKEFIERMANALGCPQMASCIFCF